MIPYSRDPQQIIPTTSVKIIGLGGAGANMLERIALDGMEGAELLALNTDIRTLGSCLATEKIQLGLNLTKGLGTGGDPDLGHQAVLESEDQIRAALKGRRIVFLCTGLGGGTGSGACSIVTRIAREEGAFVVVFATMPFAFEGRRRREQAETALNELAVLSNALVTFDNNRMGELVLAKQGIHEAFVAADHMICESIKAVIRLVVRPGLIHVGLDDLMSALRTNRSRCLFGSGIAKGKDRASRALHNALSSPLLDQGSLLKQAQTVLVHLCGGEDLTLYEIELLMQRLQKFIPESAHLLFGAAVDPSMGDSLSLTLISALPEDKLTTAPRESLSKTADGINLLDPSHGFTPPPREPEPAIEPLSLPDSVKPPAPETIDSVHSENPAPLAEQPSFATEAADSVRKETTSSSMLSKFRRTLTGQDQPAGPLLNDDRPFAEPEAAATRKKTAKTPKTESAFQLSPESPELQEAIQTEPAHSIEPVAIAEFVAFSNEATAETYVEAEPDPTPIEDDEDFNMSGLESTGFVPIPRKRPTGVPPWAGGKTSIPQAEGKTLAATDSEPPINSEEKPASYSAESELPRLKLGIKPAGPQSELSFESTPRGRFEGEGPNVVDGEDLDLPPFLRKKK